MVTAVPQGHLFVVCSHGCQHSSPITGARRCTVCRWTGNYSLNDKCLNCPTDLPLSKHTDNVLVQPFRGMVSRVVST